MINKTTSTFLLLAGMFLSAGTAAAQGIAKGYIISGTVAGADTGKVYFSRQQDGQTIIDSARLKQGKFSLKGTLPGAVFASLKVAGKPYGLSLFAENARIDIKGSVDSFYKATVTGSASHTILKEWFASWNIIHETAGPIYKKLESGKKDSTGNVTVASDPVVKAEVDRLFAQLDDTQDSLVNNLLVKYPNSAVSPWVIIDRYVNYPNPEKADKFYNMLSAAGKATIYGKEITEYKRIAAKTNIGATPDFTIADTAGNLLKLSSLKGKYVLVDFWASWCAPCRKENPNVVKAYKTYHDKGFEIVGVSLDTKKEAWLKAINKDGLTWSHVSDLKGWESDTVKEFGIRSVPMSLLLDKDGKVIGKNLREEALQEKLESLFN